MTTRKPLVLINGTISELQIADDVGLMPLGAGGIGLTDFTGTAQLLLTGDLNDLLPTGFYRFAGGIGNTPFGGISGNLIHLCRSSASRAQWAISDNGVLAYRIMTTTWGTWQYPVRGNYDKTITDFGASIGACAAAANVRSLLSVEASEVGTFTPYVYGASTAGAATYTAQLGRYTKIGNRVFYQISLVWSGHTGAGALRIGGLPFVSQSLSYNTPTSGSILASSVVYDGTLVGIIVNGVSSVYLRCTKSGVAFVDVTILASGVLLFSGSYEV